MLNALPAMRALPVFFMLEAQGYQVSFRDLALCTIRPKGVVYTFEAEGPKGLKHVVELKAYYFAGNGLYLRPRENHYVY